ncbi:MAG: outer membrane beta-barrel family protein [Chitinophagaceae bacterium]
MRHFCVRFCVVLLLTNGICQTVKGQADSAMISGLTNGMNNKPLIGATVFLLRQKDSGLVKTDVTDNEGKFQFEHLRIDSYLVSVTYVGYKKYYSQPLIVNVSQAAFSLPDIVLIQNGAGTLAEVSVSAKRPFIERKIDRTVLNIDGAIANAGNNAMEILEIAPGISINSDGSLNLKGKKGVNIYVDDKPTNLSGEDLSNYLRSLPYGTIDKIELITNPPAKYDAAGNAGIINIKTKKIKAGGFNGSVTASYAQGFYGRTSNSLNLNYRMKKVNLFANIGYSESTRRLLLEIDRKYKNADGSAKIALETNSINKRQQKGTLVKFGFDHYITKKTTWGIVFSDFVTPISQRINTNNQLLNSGNLTDSIVVADSYIIEHRNNKAVNLNLIHSYDNNGKELSANLDYVNYSWRNAQSFNNFIYNPDNTLKSNDEVIGNLPTNIDIYSAKADYIHPLSEGTRMEAGVKSSFTKTRNLAEYFNRVGNLVTPDYDKTNNLRYQETINAGYVNFSREYRRFAIQAGLRFENTVARGGQLGNVMKPDSVFKRNYSNLFPTGYLSYKLDTNGNSVLTATYGKRISRPYYQDLNPFLLFIDKFTYDAGNPFLKPMLSHNIELAYSYKELIKITLMYGHTKDYFIGTTERQNDILIERPGNAGKYISRGLSLELSKNIVKWWTVNFYGDVLNDHYQGQLYGSNLDTSAFLASASINNQFKLGKGWSAELNANYQSQKLEGQTVTNAVGQVSAGVRKSILNNKAAIRLNVRDIFYSIKYTNRVTNIRLVEQLTRNINDTRFVNLTFSYQFGKRTKQRDHERTSADNEKDRVKEQ